MGEVAEHEEQLAAYRAQLRKLPRLRKLSHLVGDAHKHVGDSNKRD